MHKEIFRSNNCHNENFLDDNAHRLEYTKRPEKNGDIFFSASVQFAAHLQGEPW